MGYYISLRNISLFKVKFNQEQFLSTTCMTSYNAINFLTISLHPNHQSSIVFTARCSKYPFSSGWNSQESLQETNKGVNLTESWR